MSSAATALPQRYLWLLGAGTLALCGSYAALVLQSATWAQVQHLANLYPDEGMCIRQFGAAAWQHAQHLAAAGALLLLGLGLALGPGTPAGRAELGALGAGLSQLARRAAQAWAALPPGQRRFFGAHLALLTAVRLYLSWMLQWHDDAVSFELFVRHGLLAVAAYYPIPNNHILANTIALGFYQLRPEFWWSMRLPVLLTSTAGTVLLFAVLLRRLGYWPALAAAGAVSWLQSSLYFAANGRGYWLLLLLAGVVFWALLTVLAEQVAADRQRVAWLALVAAGVLGSYAVPTFFYVLASAWSWLLLQAARRRSAQLGKRAVVTGAIVSLGVVLLYTPTLYVSGLAPLVANPYVEPLAAAEFWRGLPAYVWLIEGYLGGQLRIGALVVLVGSGLFAGLVWRGHAGRLATDRYRQVRQLGWPALWFVGVPYLLLLVQHVLPPERTLLYKAWFAGVLVALGLAGRRWPRPQRWLLGAGALVFMLYQVAALLRDTRQIWLVTTGQRTEYQWFSQHPRVLFPPDRPPSPLHCPVADSQPVP